MREDWIKDEYFEWMYDYVTSGRYIDISFRKLLAHLHNTEFTYLLDRDENRAKDGMSLRYHFALSQGDPRIEYELDGPCSVLEMILALAIKCEEKMDNPDYGDRTGQWFWGMITNLGLGSCTDNRYEKQYVNFVLDRFINREYDPDGKGGLFTVKRVNRDMRNVEIWYQLNWFIDNLIFPYDS